MSMKVELVMILSNASIMIFPARSPITCELTWNPLLIHYETHQKYSA